MVSDRHSDCVDTGHTIHALSIGVQCSILTSFTVRSIFFSQVISQQIMVIDRMLISQKFSALQTCDDRGEDGSGRKAGCVHSTAVQWSPGVQCSTGRPHRLRCDQSQSRPVRRQTPASEQTSGPGRHWTLDRQTLLAYRPLSLEEPLPRWTEVIMSLFLLCWHSVFGHSLSQRFRV